MNPVQNFFKTEKRRKESNYERGRKNVSYLYQSDQLVQIFRCKRRETYKKSTTRYNQERSQGEVASIPIIHGLTMNNQGIG